jgi:hypothetical protein
MSISHVPFSFEMMLRIGKSIHSRLVRFRDTLFTSASVYNVDGHRNLERDLERTHHTDYSVEYLHYEAREQASHRAGPRLRRLNSGNRIHPMY